MTASTATHDHSLHDGDAAGHVHVLSALQEEALCWTVGCFVVVAIAFAVWTLRATPKARPRRRVRKRTRRRRR